MDILRKSRIPPVVQARVDSVARTEGSSWTTLERMATRARTGALHPCPIHARLSGCEFQQFNRGEVAHVPTNALGCIEQHMRFGAERVAQHT